MARHIPLIRRGEFMRSAAVVATFCFSILGAAGAQNALASVVKKHTLIPPEPLGTALQTLARERGFQLICRADIMKGRKTAGISGNFTVREALAGLLQDSGLTYRYLDATTVTIVPLFIEGGNRADARRPSGGIPAPKAHTSGGKEGKSSSSGRFRLAQMAQETSASADSVGAAERRTDGDTQTMLQEILVTAQKYSQRAFDVPLDLQVVTGLELQQLDITSLNQLQYDVPGLFVMGANVNHYVVLRGVSNPAGNGSIVGQYIDDADISNVGYVGQSGYGTGDLQLYDLARVEVLKGPQGTLYGDGALGGVIRYITNTPALDHTQVGAAVSALFTQYGAPSEHIETMLNAPIIPGTLGVRIAGDFQHNGGWVDEPVAQQKNINGVDLTDLRIEALWQPSANFNALAKQIIHREAYGLGFGEDSNGDITPAFGVTSVPNGNQSFNLSNLALTVDFPAAQLLSSSTYWNHANTNYNQTYTTSTQIELLALDPIANESYSEELRLHGTDNGPWHWLVGGFFKHELDHIDYGGSAYFAPPGTPLSAAPSVTIEGSAEQDNSEAVFADTSLDFLGRFTLGAGVRYFKDRFNYVYQGALFDEQPIAGFETGEQHSTSTDPRFYLQYRQSSQLNFYMSATKGFRAGEPNEGIFQGYGPESLWSYDLGSKMQFLQNHLRSNVDVFYENYSNYVGEGLVTTLGGLQDFGTFNIGAARIRGVDADVTWASRNGWKITANGEVVDSKFAAITARETGYLVGERLPDSPPYSFTGSVEREFDWSGRQAYALLSYSEVGQVGSAADPLVKSDVINFASFRTGVRWNQSLRLAFFVENLLNDRGYLDPDWNDTAADRPRPRTFGIDFSVNF